MLKSMINPALSGKKSIRVYSCSFVVKKVALLFTLLLLTVSAFAQTPEWVWATSAGGSDSDEGNSIAIDDAGNKYITGCFKGTASFGAYTLTSEIPFYDFFVAKMDADGNWLWATGVESNDYGNGQGIVLDTAGNIYVTGHFRGITSFGSHTLSTINNSIDVFVAKIDAHGNWLWATAAGGSEVDKVCGIAINAAGDAYVTGYFQGTAYFGPYAIATNIEYKDIIVAKVDANGHWLWAERAGDSDHDRGQSIAVDAADNIYVTGFFSNTASFGPHMLTAISSSYCDFFVAKMDAAGNWLWATGGGGNHGDEGNSITVDAVGNVYVTGYFSESISFGSHTLISTTSAGADDIFVAKTDANGNWLWATGADTNSFNVAGRSIAVDVAGNAYVTGRFNEIVSFGSDTLTSNGSKDIFLAKTDANGNWLWAEGVGSSGFEYGNSIAVDAAGSAYVTGRFKGTVYFGSHTLTAVDDSRDIFVAKISDPVNTEDYELPVNHNYQLTNHPNPFNGETTISFSLNNEQNEQTQIEIYNVKGQLVETLVNLPINQSGNQQITWDSAKQASGVYFYKLVVDGKPVDTKKMMLIK